MALNFGLLASGLFPTSESVGDGLNADVATKIINDAGGLTWQLKQTIKLTAAGTTFDFQGLDINTEGYYRIIANLGQPAANAALFLFINGNTTAADYRCQELTASAGVIAAVRNSSSVIAVLNTTKADNVEVNIWRSKEGYGCFRARVGRLFGVDIAIRIYEGLDRTNVLANITRLSLVAEQNLPVGSTASLYALQADI